MSPRKRTKDKWLPQRVYKGRSAYEYHPKSGGAIRLCGLDATKSQVFQALALHLEEAPNTINAIANDYFKHDRFTGRAPRTRKDYEECWKRLQPVFGKMDAAQLQPHHIRKYMDMRTSKKRANLERVFLKNIYTLAVETGKVPSNPVNPTKPFPMKGRDRYVTDQEYQMMYDQAPPILQVFMELAYICAARGQDIRVIKLSDITEEGLLITQQKTGKKQVKLWNDRLRKAIKQAQDIRAEILSKRAYASMYLILSSRGRPYTAESLKTLWARHRLPDMDWTFHDLKAKGISDFEGDKQQFSGHKSRLQMERYNRTADKTNVIGWKE